MGNLINLMLYYVKQFKFYMLNNLYGFAKRLRGGDNGQVVQISYMEYGVIYNNKKK